MSRETLLKAGALLATGAATVYTVCRFFSTPKEADIDFFRYSASVKDCREFFGTADMIDLLVHANKITDGFTVYNVPAKDDKQLMITFDIQDSNPTVHIKKPQGRIVSITVDLDTLPKKNESSADERQVTATGDEGTAIKAVMHICRVLQSPKQLTSQKTKEAQDNRNVSFVA